MLFFARSTLYKSDIFIVQMQGMAGYGYNAGVSYPVMTSNMAPGTVQQWEQPQTQDGLYPTQ